jgi:hypothetical protein
MARDITGGKMYQKYKKCYMKLIDSFVETLDCFNTTGMPAIHIPIIGSRYEHWPVKIAFFGIETYGWLSFQGFMEQYAGDGTTTGSTEKAFDYLTKSTSPANYPEWTNNLHTSFWDYVFQFLTAFYKLPESDFTKNDNYMDLLESFIWGNTNSMERYETTAKNSGALCDDWAHIKNASEIFDTPRYILDICKPDILLIMNWGKNESWLVGDKRVNHFELDSHHWHYKIKKTHVYWLPHPRYTSSLNGAGFEKSIKLIINDYENR